MTPYGHRGVKIVGHSSVKSGPDSYCEYATALQVIKDNMTHNQRNVVGVSPKQPATIHPRAYCTGTHTPLGKLSFAGAP